MNPTLLKLLWAADPSNREKLAAVLEEPVLVHALQLLVLAGLPTPTAGIAPNDVQGHALQNTRREGFFEFYKALFALAETEGVAPTTPTNLQPWQHAKTRKRAATQPNPTHQ